MRLKNRTINNVKIVTDLNTHARSTCYKCKVKGDGILFTMYRPQKGKRFVCFSCLMKMVLSDVISRHEQKKEQETEAVIDEQPKQVPSGEDIHNAVIAVARAMSEDIKSRKKRKNESDRTE